MDDGPTSRGIAEMRTKRTKLNYSEQSLSSATIFANLGLSGDALGFIMYCLTLSSSCRVVGLFPGPGCSGGGQMSMSDVLIIFLH